MLLGTSISGSHVFPPLPCLCRLLLLAVVLCSWTCRSYEVANTWIWWLRAGHRSAKQAMGVSGACAGCWWVQRRQTGHFLRHAADGRQERQGRGERELPRTEGDARATSQAKTSSCTPSTRRSASPFTTSASSSSFHVSSVEILYSVVSELVSQTLHDTLSGDTLCLRECPMP